MYLDFVAIIPQADDISARGGADALAFSDSKHNAMRFQVPNGRNEIP